MPTALFVSGVDPEVTRAEFAREFKVTAREMNCCVTLGYLAVDTRSNAGEAAQWMESNGVRSVRLVTTDWHMRRACGRTAPFDPEDDQGDRRRGALQTLARPAVPRIQ